MANQFFLKIVTSMSLILVLATADAVLLSQDRSPLLKAKAGVINWLLGTPEIQQFVDDLQNRFEQYRDELETIEPCDISAMMGLQGRLGSLLSLVQGSITNFNQQISNLEKSIGLDSGGSEGLGGLGGAGGRGANATSQQIIGLRDTIPQLESLAADIQNLIDQLRDMIEEAQRECQPPEEEGALAVPTGGGENPPPPLPPLTDPPEQTHVSAGGGGQGGGNTTGGGSGDGNESGDGNSDTPRDCPNLAQLETELAAKTQECETISNDISATLDAANAAASNGSFGGHDFGYYDELYQNLRNRLDQCRAEKRELEEAVYELRQRCVDEGLNLTPGQSPVGISVLASAALSSTNGPALIQALINLATNIPLATSYVFASGNAAITTAIDLTSICPGETPGETPIDTSFLEAIFGRDADSESPCPEEEEIIDQLWEASEELIHRQTEHGSSDHQQEVIDDAQAEVDRLTEELTKCRHEDNPPSPPEDSDIPTDENPDTWGEGEVIL